MSIPMNYPAAIILLLILLSSCTKNPLPLTQLAVADLEKVDACTVLFAETEKAIIAAQVVDSESARISGYPYLRVNRLLSSFRNEVTGRKFDAWVDLMQQQAKAGWQVEITNLPQQFREDLENTNKIENSAIPSSLDEALNYCGILLRDLDLATEAGRNELRDKAVVPGDYRTWQRVVGLYPLTAWVFKAGISQWHQENRELFKLPLQQLPVLGSLVQYTPGEQTHQLSAMEVAGIIKQSSDNSLHIPVPDDAQSQRLLDSFAPIFEIDEFSDQDRIGTPVWQDENNSLINTSKATIYRHISHTRINKLILLQLNYTFWFPSRPYSSDFDLLGGHMDGITWRVTLLPDGRPWLFDTIHNCGCYHLFFPTQHAQVVKQPFQFAESAFIPQQHFTVDSRKRVVVRIAANTHYIQRIYVQPALANDMARYHSEPAVRLRSLPVSDGSFRSLFRENGIVSGTERGERFFFWPMGIPDPGAMRQWGHHATAFVGRRHFDDARIFENTFAIVKSTGSN